jgi:hypothetical protein
MTTEKLEPRSKRWWPTFKPVGTVTMPRSQTGVSAPTLRGAVHMALPFKASTLSLRSINDSRRKTEAARARYVIDHVLPISADVIVAQVARLALDPTGDPIPPSSEDDASFSEMAMYVLVCRNGDWWLAAGQKTRIRPGGAA